MRILLYLGSLDYGGAERQATVIAAGLARKGHTVSVATLYRAGSLAPELTRQGVTITSLGKTGPQDIVRPYVRLLRMARDVDILYSLLPAQNIVACAVRPVLGRTQVVTGIRAADVETARYGWAARLAYRLEAPLQRLAQRTIANSEAGRRWAIARGLRADRIVVVPNGIDTDRFRPNPQAGDAFRAAHGLAPDRRLIGLVSRLDPQKDHETFLEAAAAVLRTRPNSHFLCVGNGPDRDRTALGAATDALGLADRVTWLPAQSDVERVYQALDILVLSSAFGEGFPNSIGEAMACGVPCAVTDSGDAVSVVGATGRSAPPRDAGALAHAIVALLDALAQDEPATRKAARNRIEAEYGLAILIARTEQVLVAAAL